MSGNEDSYAKALAVSEARQYLPASSHTILDLLEPGQSWN